MEKLEQETITEGLCLGIDFGCSKIQGAVWSFKKKRPIIVKQSNPKDSKDIKYQIPSTLRITPKKVEPRSTKNLNEATNDPEMAIEDLSFEAGVEMDHNDDLNYYIYDIKKLIGNNNPEMFENLRNNKTEQFDQLKNSFTYQIEPFENRLVIKINKKIYEIESICSLLFMRIKKDAVDRFQSDIIAASISVPHCFNSNQKNAIRRAAEIAGIKTVFIINDPLSTAIYYASDNTIRNDENILIVDFGKSKLEVSVLSISKKNVINVITSGGNSNYGGEQFNKILEKEYKEEYFSKGGNDFTKNANKLMEFKNSIEKAKVNLSFKKDSEIQVKKLDDKNDFNEKLDRAFFDEMTSTVNNTVLECIDSVIEESKVPIDQIAHIILQGDAIRVASLTKEIKKKFPENDVITDLYDSICQGAAIYTARKMRMLNNDKIKKLKVFDVTPLSIGIRTEGDLMSVILKRGQKIPVRARKFLITTQDSQKKVKIEIFAGERKLVKDNVLISQLMLDKIPDMQYKGKVRVEIIFEVNEEGKLKIIAQEEQSGAYKEIEVDINSNFDQENINYMIASGYENEKEDEMEMQRIKSMLKLNDNIIKYSHEFGGFEDVRRDLESFRTWVKHSSNVPKEDYDNKILELEQIIKEKVKFSKNATRRNDETS